MEVAAMEENPSCDEGVDPTYLLSPCLTRKRKGASLPCKGTISKDNPQPQKKHDGVDMDGTAKGEGCKAPKKRKGKDTIRASSNNIKDKNADEESEEENGGKSGKLRRLSSSSGRSSKRKELDLLQCEISEMKSKLSQKQSPLTKPFFKNTYSMYNFKANFNNTRVFFLGETLYLGKPSGMIVIDDSPVAPKNKGPAIPIDEVWDSKKKQAFTTIYIYIFL